MPTRTLRSCRSVAGFRAFALVLLLSASPVSIDAALAQQSRVTAQRSFTIPAGPLSSALVVFGQQAGIQVSYVPSVAAGRTSPGVSGTMSPNAALGQLLAGTGLSFQMRGANTVVVSNAAGNNAAATVDGAIALDTIDVSGGGGAAAAAADEPYRTPGSTSYVSTEQLERVPATTAGDMFRGVPGVDIRGNHNGVQMDVAIRGQHGNNRVKVMIEGTQQEASTHQGYNGQDNHSYVDQDLISSIKIEKGPVAGPYGAGVTGGVVNMSTLTADDILLPGRQVGVRLRGSLIGNSTKDAPPTGTAVFNYDRPALFDFLGRSGSAAIAARTDAVEIVAAISERKRGNYFAGKKGTVSYGPAATNDYSFIPRGAEVFNTSEDSRSTLLKGVFKFGDGHSVEIGHLRSESDYGWIYPIMLTLPAERKQQPLNWMQSDRAWARYKWNPSDNDLIHFQANIWKAKLQKYDYYGTAPVPIGRGPGIVDTWGAEVWNESRIATSFGSFAATYGGEYSMEEANLEGGYLGNQATREVGSVFANVKWKPWDWLTFNAGMRYTTFRTQGGYQTGGGLVEESQEGSGLTPSVGVTFEVADGLQLFAQYTEGYRPPSIRETVPQAWAGYPVNPTLRPEQSRNVEIGANLLRRGILRSDDALRTKLAYFNNRYEDYIAVMVPATYYYNNIPGAKIDGIEFSGAYSIGSVFAEAKFNYYTTYEYCYEPGSTYADGCTQYIRGGVFGFSAPPKYSGSLTLGTKLLDNKLTIGTTTRFFSKSAIPWKLPNGNFVFNTPMWRPDAIVDVFGSYKFSDHFEISASVENIFDRYYIDPMAVAKLPAPGRTFRVGGTLKLDDHGNYGFDGVSLPELTTPISGYNWSGAFIGLDAGYLAAEASAEGDFAGTLRTGSNASNYVWHPYRSAMKSGHEPGNLSGGLFAGYNLQLNSPVVIGVDANFGYIGSTDIGEGRFTAPAVSDPVTRMLTANVTSGFDWQAGLRGRVGVAFDRTLPYIAGGLAVAQYSYNYTSFALSQTSAAARTLPDPTKLKDTYLGWALGAGIEHAMTDNLLFRAEYRYSDFGKKTFDTPAGAHQIDLTSQEWRLGVAYKF